MPPTASTTTTSRPTLTSSHSHRPSHSKPKSSTTPYGPPPSRTPASVGLPRPPSMSTSNALSPKGTGDPRTPSPNYFGFVVESSNPPGSNPGEHVRRNWDFPTSQAHTTTATPRAVPVDANPEFEAFRRSSETRPPFSLSQNSLTSFSARSRPAETSPRTSPTAQKRPSRSPLSPDDRRASPPSLRKDDGRMEVDSDDPTAKSFFDLPSQDSPSSSSSGLTIPDIPSHRHSVPHNHPSSSSSHESLKVNRPGRAETLPASGVGAPAMISPDELAAILEAEDVLILDLRVFPQFSASRIRGALNLCIPTTLLKRPSFNLQKLLDTFTNNADKQRFSRWRQCKSIVVYDSNSSAMKEAIAPSHVLSKFINDGWNGHASVLKGGYLGFARKYPDLLEKGQGQGAGGTGKQMLSLSAAPEVAPVAGGCPMPKQNPANPFFGNIRQNMDLIGGVGQMSIKQPPNMPSPAERLLPTWLRAATDTGDEGKAVSDKFLHIEQTEQKRMQEALSGHVSYGTPGPRTQDKIQVAGIEKGSKNRYNNIFPYDHARVKLQEISNGDCDYVNASHVKTSYSNKHYVATQAPIPATFHDFWRMVWEQDIRVIVMLTAEAEGGQVKSHPYWNSGEFGPMRVKSLSEKKVSLVDSPKSTHSAPSKVRPGIGQRRSTNPHTALEKVQAAEDAAPSSEPPFIIVRHLTLSHSAHAFQPMREITQIQYTSWPDFGAPADAKDVLSLIKHTDKYVRNTMTSGQTLDPNQPMPENQRPVLVHCSAGCGRTGTFCTIDSVIDMLKRQRLGKDDDRSTGKSPASSFQMDIEKASDDWISRDDIDLIHESVNDFRSQRLSMVQSLRQYVLCYESVLQWLVSEEEKGLKGIQERKRLVGHTPRHSLGN